MKDLIFSLDAETNGLYGEAFAIGVAIFTSNGSFAHSWHGICPLPSDDIIDPWVKENVAPYYKNQTPWYKDYNDLLQGFANFYLIYQKMNNIDVVCHMGVPVEAKLFIDMRAKGLIEDLDGPYPLIDISAYPEINTSVDSYIETFHVLNTGGTNGIPEGLSTHNALYDAYVAGKAYIHYNSIMK